MGYQKQFHLSLHEDILKIED